MLRLMIACGIAALLSCPAAGGQSSAECAPSFTSVPFNRGLPHAYVDQGLQSIPKLFPKHQLLVQRRNVATGPVAYSLLVYMKDAAADAVTIEGVAVLEQQAWQFSASCDARRAWDGLVTTLERIAALPREQGKR
jgi:hypothetical protein